MGFPMRQGRAHHRCTITSQMVSHSIFYFHLCLTSWFEQNQLEGKWCLCARNKRNKYLHHNKREILGMYTYLKEAAVLRHIVRLLDVWRETQSFRKTLPKLDRRPFQFPNDTWVNLVILEVLTSIITHYYCQPSNQWTQSAVGSVIFTGRRKRQPLFMRWFLCRTLPNYPLQVSLYVNYSLCYTTYWMKLSFPRHKMVC